MHLHLHCAGMLVATPLDQNAPKPSRRGHAGSSLAITPGVRDVVVVRSTKIVEVRQIMDLEQSATTRCQQRARFERVDGFASKRIGPKLTPHGGPEVTGRHGTFSTTQGEAKRLEAVLKS